MSEQRAEQSTEAARGAFSHRRVFIFAAIGSAVGLGNIWRFPYVAYDNGGGAFLIPYLVALLAAGLPFLLLDYAVGHRYRGSAPLSLRRLAGRTGETLGWWQVGICAVIAIYYAAIIAYAIRYTFFSIDKAWGTDPEGYFMNDFLGRTTGFGFDFVAGVLVPVILVWVAVVAIMTAGVQNGIGRTAVVFIPVLALAFIALVVQALFLPGAAEGLNAFFTPDWGALTNASVWAAAVGQIFFSLSVGFGIMITYASYVDRKTDMTGSGLVVGTANSSFELLAGIGVFAALGFMAQANGVAVDEVVTNGIGLAFVAFPAIISEAPAGALIGVLFFGSLVLAGLTSLVSVIEVVISAVRDKLGLSRVVASLAVTVPVAVVSSVLFGTTTGLDILDAMDHFINRFGILLVAVVTMLFLAWRVRALAELRAHLNATGSVRLGGWWSVLIAAIIPVALIYVLIDELLLVLDKPYAGLPTWMITTFGWGTAALVVAIALVLAQLPWSRRTPLEVPTEEVSR